MITVTIMLTCLAGLIAITIICGTWYSIRKMEFQLMEKSMMKADIALEELKSRERDHFGKMMSDFILHQKGDDK